MLEIANQLAENPFILLCGCVLFSPPGLFWLGAYHILAQRFKIVRREDVYGTNAINQ